MTNMKESVLAALQGAELTVPQLVEQLGIKTKDPCNDARTYVNRLKAEGKVREVSKAGKAKVYTAGAPATPAQDPGIQAAFTDLKAAFGELYNFFNIVMKDPSKMDSELDKLNIAAIDKGVKLCE